MTSNPIEKSFSGLILPPLFLVMLAVIPWLHGGELPWEIFLFAALSVLILAAHLVCTKNKVKQELLRIKLPLSLLIIWFAYHCLYLLPFPSELIDWLSPSLIEDFPLSETLLLTVSKSLTLIELARIACVICAFVLCYLFAKHKAQQLIILKVIFYSGAVMALYSQLNYYTNGQYELVEAIPPWNVDWATTVRGTFSYKNQYAIYSALAIFVGLGLFVQGLQKQHQVEPISSLSSILRNVLFEKHIITLVLLIVMFVSLVGSDSRGGVLIFFITCLIFVVNYFVCSKNKSWTRKHTLGATGILIVFITIFAFSKSFERYENAGLNDHGRSLLHVTATKVIADYPLFGTGPGTYPVVQHHYKTTDLGNSDMSKHAHNDYLELLSTQGIIGFLLFSSPLVLLLFKIYKNSPAKKAPLALGGQTAITCLLLHSLIDFNFSSLVFGLYFFVLLALLLRMVEANELQQLQRDARAN